MYSAAESGQYGADYEGHDFGGSFGAKAVRLGLHSFISIFYFQYLIIISVVVITL
jgi:hypothetical protein